MNDPFENVSSQEMSETIDEGAILLARLEKLFEENANILEMVKHVQKEVNRFSDFLNIVLILKDESFKERHWQVCFYRIKLLQDILVSVDTMGRDVHLNLGQT